MQTTPVQLTTVKALIKAKGAMGANRKSAALLHCVYKKLRGGGPFLACALGVADLIVDLLLTQAS